MAGGEAWLMPHTRMLPLLCWFLDAGNSETFRTLREAASKKRQGTGQTVPVAEQESEDSDKVFPTGYGRTRWAFMSIPSTSRRSSASEKVCTEVNLPKKHRDTPTSGFACRSHSKQELSLRCG